MAQDISTLGFGIQHLFESPWITISEELYSRALLKSLELKRIGPSEGCSACICGLCGNTCDELVMDERYILNWCPTCVLASIARDLADERGETEQIIKNNSPYYLDLRDEGEEEEGVI